MKTLQLKRDKVFVSDRDYARVRRHRWYVTRTGYTGTKYVARNFNGRLQYLHRFILGLGSGDPEVDHRNRNTLNNMRSNLRLANPSLNQANCVRRNREGYKGIQKIKNGWSAKIKRRDTTGKIKNIYLGFFDTPEKAAHAYDRAARRHFGSFARTNF